ncbi:hypothetical protein [[Ruminococcus] torques]|uniref:hypothetical protein n=1 Tax=[Ruminococcus] torques TaxID=33039 RepID=UPI003AB15F54
MTKLGDVLERFSTAKGALENVAAAAGTKDEDTFVTNMYCNLKLILEELSRIEDDLSMINGRRFG